MLLNKKLFIHIPKNAGMTIRHSPMLKDKTIVATTNVHKSAEYSRAVLNKMNSLGDHHGYEHARWRDIRKDVTDNVTAFAVVRNPWDRVVSRFFFAKKLIEVEKKISHTYADVSSFEAFLEERHKWGNEKYMWHRAVRGWYPTVDHVTDEAGNLKCDMIRFDKLNEDLIEYFNIPLMSRARNVTAMNTHATYMDMYTDKTEQIVADWYAKDIEMWGYDFDSGPTRNFWKAE